MQTQISKIEKQIQVCEAEIHALNTKFIEDSTHVTPEDYKRHDDLQNQVEELTAEWEKLVSQS